MTGDHYVTTNVTSRGGNVTVTFSGHGVTRIGVHGVDYLLKSDAKGITLQLLDPTDAGLEASLHTEFIVSPSRRRVAQWKAERNAYGRRR